MQADGGQNASHARADDGEAQTLAVLIDGQVILLSAVFLSTMMTRPAAERIMQMDQLSPAGSKRQPFAALRPA
jgi:uncharacterized protein (DUF983 family)